MASFVWHQGHEMYTGHRSKTHSSIHTAFKSNLPLTEWWHSKGLGCCRQAGGAGLQKPPWKANKHQPTNPPHHEILPLGRNSPRYQHRLQPTSWKSALQERPWGSWRTRWTMTQSLQQRPAALGAVSGRAFPLGWVEILFCSPVLVRQTWNAGSCAGLPRPRETGMHRSEPSKGTLRWLRDWVSVTWGEADRAEDMQPGAEKAQRRILSKCRNTWWEGIKTTELDWS